jgi:hypothetical protein
MKNLGLDKSYFIVSLKPMDMKRIVLILCTGVLLLLYVSILSTSGKHLPKSGWVFNDKGRTGMAL